MRFIKPIIALLITALIASAGIFAYTTFQDRQTKIAQAKQTKEINKIDKQTFKKLNQQADKLIKGALVYNNGFDSQVITRDVEDQPSSALHFGHGNTMDNILQIYVADPELKEAAQQAADLWNGTDLFPYKIVQLVDSPDKANAAIVYGSQKDLPIPKGFEAITYYNEKGEFGKMSYLVIGNPNLTNNNPELKTLIAHEMGHALGLAHSEPDGTTKQEDNGDYDLMNVVVSSRTPFSLSPYDKLALQAAIKNWPKTQIDALQNARKGYLNQQAKISPAK
jgi:predicted Zn-dependent protease